MDLKEYIKAERRKGFSDQKICSALRKAGYSDSEINRSLKRWPVVILYIIAIVTIASLIALLFRQGEENVQLEEEADMKLISFIDHEFKNCILNVKELREAIIWDNVSLCDENGTRDITCEDEFYFWSSINYNEDRCGNITDPRHEKLCRTVLYDRDDCSDHVDMEGKVLCQAYVNRDSGKCTDSDLREPVQKFCKQLPVIPDALREQNTKLCKRIDYLKSREFCIQIVEPSKESRIASSPMTCMLMIEDKVRELSRKECNLLSDDEAVSACKDIVSLI